MFRILIEFKNFAIKFLTSIDEKSTDKIFCVDCTFTSRETKLLAYVDKKKLHGSFFIKIILN